MRTAGGEAAVVEGDAAAGPHFARIDYPGLAFHGRVLPVVERLADWHGLGPAVVLLQPDGYELLLLVSQTRPA